VILRGRARAVKGGVRQSAVMGESGARARLSAWGQLVSDPKGKKEGAAREMQTGGPQVSGPSSPSCPHMAWSAEGGTDD
jgi:hypothetical protein